MQPPPFPTASRGTRGAVASASRRPTRRLPCRKRAAGRSCLGGRRRTGGARWRLESRSADTRSSRSATRCRAGGRGRSRRRRSRPPRAAPATSRPDSTRERRAGLPGAGRGLAGLAHRLAGRADRPPERLRRRRLGAGPRARGALRAPAPFAPAPVARDHERASRAGGGVQLRDLRGLVARGGASLSRRSVPGRCGLARDRPRLAVGRGGRVGERLACLVRVSVAAVRPASRWRTRAGRCGAGRSSTRSRSASRRTASRSSWSPASPETAHSPVLAAF